MYAFLIIFEVCNVRFLLDFIKLNGESFSRSKSRLFFIERPMIEGIYILSIGEVLNVEQRGRSFCQLIFVVGRVGVCETFLAGSVDIDAFSQSSTFGGNNIGKLKLIVAIVALVI